jgi:hypothetical protein
VNGIRAKQLFRHHRQDACPVAKAGFASLDNADVGDGAELDRAGGGPMHGGVVEQLLFGTRELDEIYGLVGAFCVSELRSPVAERLFHETSVGVVFGLHLADGRRVVVKVHQPRETLERLRAKHEIQAVLFAAGLPCPQPLTPPAKLGNGHATVETLLDNGEFRDTHDPICRRLIAEALAHHLEITGQRPAPEALAGGWSLLATERLWPEHAHSPIFDFNASSVGAEWIDALGAQARAVIVPTGRLMAGHSDWSGKHFRFDDGKITAIYDWDSLAVRSEAALVGIAAMTYTTRFDLPDVPRFPAPDEMRAFVEDYNIARSAPLTAQEREQIAAHGLLLAAYTARCEHCGLNGYDGTTDPASFTTALRIHGTSYLRQ